MRPSLPRKMPTFPFANSSSELGPREVMHGPPGLKSSVMAPVFALTSAYLQQEQCVLFKIGSGGSNCNVQR